MTEVTRSVQQARAGGVGLWSFGISLILGVLLTLGVMAVWMMTLPEAQRTGMLTYWSSVQVPALSFNPTRLMKAPVSVQLHVAAAVVALFVGAVIFLLPKGTGFHKLLGWTWVSSMIIVAATSIAMIVDLRTGINALHVFTAITVISLWGGLTAIRRGDVKRHAGSMIGLYVGGLIIAGAFAFIPGRVMWATFFGG
jgi:uncharacterized membrane protein